MGFNPKTMDMAAYPDAARVLENALQAIEQGQNGVRLWYETKRDAFRMRFRLYQYRAANRAQNQDDPNRYTYLTISMPEESSDGRWSVQVLSSFDLDNLKMESV